MGPRNNTLKIITDIERWASPVLGIF